MRAGRACGVAALVLLYGISAGPCLSADPVDGGITVTSGSGASIVVTPAEIAELPAVHVTVAFGTEHGPREAAFDGPLLWTVLDHAHALELAKPREQVRQFVTVTGRDGYTAVLAVGEISPEFEGKQIIVAERMDGQTLAPEHFRVVVPGDRRGGRSVRDLIRIAVAAADSGAR